MKKFFAILAAVALVACEEVNAPVLDTEISDNALSEYTFDINVGGMDSGAQTKAIKTDWADGDKINIWFNGSVQATPDLIMTYNGSTQKWTYGTISSGFTPSDGKKLVALYESSNDIGSFTTESYGGYTVFNRYLEFYDTNPNSGSVYSEKSIFSNCGMIATSSNTYSYDSTTKVIEATFSSWSMLSRLQVLVKGLPKEKASQYIMELPGATSLRGFHLLNSSNIYVPQPSDKSYFDAVGQSNPDGVAFYFYAPNPDDGIYDHSVRLKYYDKNYNLIWSTNDDSDESIKPITVSDNKCTGIYFDEVKFSKGYSAVSESAQGHSTRDWVQLWAGGPRFALYNVGSYINNDYATTNGDEKYYTDRVGGLYAFGNGTINGRAKGGDWTVKNAQTNLHDVATYLWGSRWRTPTAEELTQMKENCSIEWVEKYNDCTVPGFIVKGKGDYSSNYIYLPAAGAYDPTEGKVVWKGTGMIIWSSTRDGSGKAKWGGSVNTENPTQNQFSVAAWAQEYAGYSVRAIVKE